MKQIKCPKCENTKRIELHLKVFPDTGESEYRCPECKHWFKVIIVTDEYLKDLKLPCPFCGGIIVYLSHDRSEGFSPGVWGYAYHFIHETERDGTLETGCGIELSYFIPDKEEANKDE